MNESADIAVQIVNFKTKTYLSACSRVPLEGSWHERTCLEINVLDNNSGQ